VHHGLALHPLWLCVGAIVGLTGVGGGSLMTPLLVLLFGIIPATAVGTDLLYAAMTKAGGTVVHGRKGISTGDRRAARPRQRAGAPLTIVVLSTVAETEQPAVHDHFDPLGVALLLTACACFSAKAQAIRGRRGHERILANRHLHRSPSPSARARRAGHDFVGRRRGARRRGAVLSSIRVFPAVRIVGSDIAHAVPLTLVAGLGHWWLGNVDWALLGALLLGSLPGIWIGSQISRPRCRSESCAAAGHHAGSGSAEN
jgi:uncharacterized membrane protein YfcA